MPGIYPIKNEKFHSLYGDLLGFTNEKLAGRMISSISIEEIMGLKEQFIFLQRTNKKSFNLLVSDSDRNTLLHKAAEDGNVVLLYFLLHSGININQLNNWHEAPLYTACLYLQVEAAKILLHQGANPSAGLLEAKKLPLFALLSPENTLLTSEEQIKAASILKELIDKGVDLNQPLSRRSQFTALHYAVMDRRKHLVKTMVDSGKVDLSKTDRDGRTALHMVADYRNQPLKAKEKLLMQEEKEIIDLIIPFAETLNSPDRWGNTPLHIAVINSNVLVVKSIVEKDYLFPQLKILNSKNKKGRTALHEAVAEAYRGPRILKLLVQLATQDELAIRSDRPENDSATGDVGETPLEMARRLIVAVEFAQQKRNELQEIMISLHGLQQIPLGTELIDSIRKAYNLLDHLWTSGLETLSPKVEKLLDLIVETRTFSDQPESFLEKIALLVQELASLITYIDEHYGFEHLKTIREAKNTLEQTDYFAWKEGPLRIASSFPLLAESRINYAGITEANNKFSEARLLFNAKNDHDAFSKLEESIHGYDRAQDYASLEKVYEYIAAHWIVKGEAASYETKLRAQQSSAYDKEKLHSHLALGSFYKTLRNAHISSAPSLEELEAYESYHYSEAYKLTQGPLDSMASVVLQREMGIAHKKRLGTYNIQQCVVVVAHDPNTDKIVLAHFDRFSGPLKFIDEILSEFSLTPTIDLYITGGRDSVTKVAPGSSVTVSDNNVNQVLKQIFINKERFTIRACDIGELAPPAIVFNYIDKKLEHRMPNQEDTSLVSRAARMSIELNREMLQKGDYLHPLNRIDFDRPEETRIKSFTSEQMHLLKEQLLDYKREYSDRMEFSETWKHNQLFFPLLIVTTENKLPERIRFSKSLLLIDQPSVSFSVPPTFDAQKFYAQQKSPQQSRDLINALLDFNRARSIAMEGEGASESSLLPSFTVEGDEFAQNQLGEPVEIEDIVLDPPAKRNCLTHRLKREVGGCFFPWEDRDRFNDYLETQDIQRRRQFVERFPIGSKRQATLRALIHKATHIEPHLQKVGRALSLSTNILFHEQALAGLLQGDLSSAVQLGGFQIVDRSLGEVAARMALAGKRLLAAGNTLGGEILRVSSPFIGQGTLLLSAFNLVKDVKDLRSNNTNLHSVAVIDTVNDAVNVAVYVLGSFEIMSPLLGGALLAFTTLESEIVKDIEIVKQENREVYLTGWERFKEGARAFLHLKPESSIQKRMDEAEYYRILLDEKLKFLRENPRIKHVIFPAIEEVGKNCYRVLTGKKLRGHGGPVFAGSPYEESIEQCVPIFTEIANNSVYLDDQYFGFRLTPENIQAPPGSGLLCVPTDQASERLVTLQKRAYACDAALGLTHLNSNGRWVLVDLKVGTDYVSALKNYSTIFKIGDGAKHFVGGELEDFFILEGKEITSVLIEGERGGLDGREGTDTLFLSNFYPDAEEIILNLQEAFLGYADKRLNLTSIERVVGGPLALDITVACDTQVIDTQGAPGSNASDKVLIPEDRACNYGLTLYIKADTRVQNEATQGNFSYHITPSSGLVSIFLTQPATHESTFLPDSQPLFMLNESFFNMAAFSLEPTLLSHTNHTQFMRVRMDFMNETIASLFSSISALFINKSHPAELARISYYFNSGVSSEQIRRLPVELSVQPDALQEILNSYPSPPPKIFQVNLTDAYQIRRVLFEGMKEKEKLSDAAVEILFPVINKISLYFKEGVLLKVENKKSYLLQQNHQNIEELRKMYAPLARQFNLVCILSSSFQELLLIGHKGHEVFHNDPMRKTHLDGNGGENLFILSAANLTGTLTQFPLNEVVLYHNYANKRTDTVDFRPIMNQLRKAFPLSFPELELITFDEDPSLVLRLSLNGTSVLKVQLKEALQTDWYRYYLHIILEIAPQKIIGSLYNLVLQPVPWVFNKSYKVIRVNAEEIEESTQLYLPTVRKQHQFFRDGDHLRVTNVFHLFKKMLPNTLLFIDYFKEPKLSTLSLRFFNNETLVFSEQEELIQAAPDFKVAWQRHEKALEDLAFQQKGLMTTQRSLQVPNSDQQGIQKTEQEVRASPRGTRSRRAAADFTPVASKAASQQDHWPLSNLKKALESSVLWLFSLAMESEKSNDRRDRTDTHLNGIMAVFQAIDLFGLLKNNPYDSKTTSISLEKRDAALSAERVSCSITFESHQCFKSQHALGLIGGCKNERSVLVWFTSQEEDYFAYGIADPLKRGLGQECVLLREKTLFFSDDYSCFALSLDSIPAVSSIEGVFYPVLNTLFQPFIEKQREIPMQALLRKGKGASGLYLSYQSLLHTQLGDLFYRFGLAPNWQEGDVYYWLRRIGGMCTMEDSLSQGALCAIGLETALLHPTIQGLFPAFFYQTKVAVRFLGSFLQRGFSMSLGFQGVLELFAYHQNNFISLGVNTLLIVLEAMRSSNEECLGMLLFFLLLQSPFWLEYSGFPLAHTINHCLSFFETSDVMSADPQRIEEKHRILESATHRLTQGSRFRTETKDWLRRTTGQLSEYIGGFFKRSLPDEEIPSNTSKAECRI